MIMINSNDKKQQVKQTNISVKVQPTMIRASTITRELGGSNTNYQNQNKGIETLKHVVVF